MLDLFLPRTCIHCSQRCVIDRAIALSNYLCETCLRIYRKYELKKCTELTYAPDDQELPSIYVRAPFRANELTQSLVHHLKYGEMPRLGIYLGREIASHLPGTALYDVVAAVPLHRTRLRERGYNQSYQIAKGIAQILQLPLLAHRHFKRIRPTKTQTKLSIAEREENIRGAFRIAERHYELVRDKRVLLVDDVMTTGATILNCAEALQQATPRSVECVVFAHALLDP